MSVISRSHLNLVRARKALEKAFAERDWDALKETDRQLGQSLNEAFDDQDRNTSELVQEMEKVLRTYASMVAALPKDAEISLSTFPTR